MTIYVRKIQDTFCAEITGVSLSVPLGDSDFEIIRNAFHASAVLVFPNQPLNDSQQVAFSRRFGPLERSLKTSFGGPPEISNITNADENNRLYGDGDARNVFSLGNQIWHTDSSFKVVPAMASALSARVVPPAGGETEFADMRAAYNALTDSMKAGIADLVAEHSFAYSQGQISLEALSDGQIDELPPVQHRVVRVHPVTGRKALYIGRHASHIVGMPLEDGRKLLADLLEHATQPRFVYRHNWTVGDLVMWDNRCVLHRGRPYDMAKHHRIMHRTTLAGDTADNPWALDRAAAGEQDAPAYRL